MGFTIAARTLLELGKELISSDEVAIYELVKNAVDAGAKPIELTARVVLPRPAYLKAKESLSPTKRRAKDEPVPTPRGVYDDVARSLAPNCRPEDGAALLAVLERALGSNAELAAALDEVYAGHNWIDVKDNGHGMSLSELSDVFLRIGTRSRRAGNVGGAKYLGDKGVGRLSVMRLGNVVEVTTSRTGETNWHVLRIDWTSLSHDSDADLGDVEVAPFEGGGKVAAASGTTIRISGLNADWSIDRFNEVMQGKIARMIDPFDQGAGNRLLVVRHNGTRVLVPSVPKPLLDGAHASVHGGMSFEGDEPVLSGMMHYGRYGKSRSLLQRGAEVYSLSRRTIKVRGKRGLAAVRAVDIDPDVIRRLGPFRFDVYWYNRRVVDKLPGFTTTPSETREQVSNWSGGPMLYRYGFRILPYGEPQDDWLELDTVAFGQAGFKLNRQQVVGRVEVQTPHTVLSEQTNRQGLIDSDAASALKTIMMWVLHTEFRSLLNQVDNEEKLNSRKAEQDALGLQAVRRQVDGAVSELRARVDPADAALVERVSKGVEDLTQRCGMLVKRIDDAVKEVTDERDKFVYLAGIGLMTDFIFHELDRSVTHTLEVITDTRRAGSAAALRSLEAQLTTLQKRISAFDELTGERRQTKSKFDLSEVVGEVIESHRNQFARHDITVRFTASPLPVRAVRGMVIQILENLVANSVYWLRQQSKYDDDFTPTLTIGIDATEKVLTVEDNGPGVAPERKEVIFQPFISSKAPQQGRGLGLYISRELAEYHDWELKMDDRPGPRPDRLNTFVLDMGDAT